MDLKSRKSECVNCCSEADIVESSKTDHVNGFLISVFGNILHSKSAVLNNLKICNNCNSCGNKLWHYRNNFLKETNPGSKIGRITQQERNVKKFFGFNISDEPKIVTEEMITCDSDVIVQVQTQKEDEIIKPTSKETNCLEQLSNDEQIKHEVVENVPDIYKEKFLELKIQKFQSQVKIFPKMFDVHSCEKCGRNFILEDKLKRHIDIAHKNVEFNFPCHFCSKKFCHYWFFKNHLKINHCGVEMIFSCSICLQNCHSQKELEQHNFLAHQITSHPFKCKYCDVAYKTIKEIENLRSHLIEHHGDTKEAEAARVNINFATESEKWLIKRTEKPCNICGKVSKSPFSRSVHIVFEHHQHQSCQTCKEVFANEDDFCEHIQISGHKLNTCATCGKRLASTTTLLRHWEYIHDKNTCTSFRCEVCGSSFPNFEKLKCHYKWHSIVASPHQFNCKQCNKHFKLKHHLKVHMAVHVVKNDETNASMSIKCKYCDKTYKKNSLKRHVLKFHLEVQQNEMDSTYKCLEPNCGLLFPSAQSLHLHERKHNENNISMKGRPRGKSAYSRAYFDKNLIIPVLKEGVTKFQCGVCHKLISRRDHMYRHLFRKHSIKYDNINSGTYENAKCKICPKICASKYVLQRHVSKFHQTNSNSAAKEKNTNLQYKCTLCPYTILDISKISDHFLTAHENTDGAVATESNAKRMKVDYKMGIKNSDYSLTKDDCIAKMENYCMPCNNIFPSISQKYDHDNRVHSTLLPCRMCNEKFDISDNLKEHLTSHSALSCHLCVNVFDCVDEYYFHLQSKHTLQPYICEFCGLFFSTKRKLVSHYRSIHCSNGNTSDSYQCKECDEVFLQYYYYNNHMENIHGIFGAFKCEQCGKSFNSEKHFKLHCKNIRCKKKKRIINNESNTSSHRKLYSEELAKHKKIEIKNGKKPIVANTRRSNRVVRNGRYTYDDSSDSDNYNSDSSFSEYSD